jgi:serine/threonine protein kinase
MVLSRERILADGVTVHPWEREGIEFLKSVIPDTEPYRLWALVDLIEPSGRRHEIDAIVLGYNALYLLELKAHPCKFSGNGVDWTVQWPEGHRTSMESPVASINRKARVLAGMLDKELRGRAPRPRVEALVFLSHERADITELDAIGRLGVVTRSDVARAITHGEFSGALSSLRDRPIMSPVVRETVLALKKLNVMGSKAALKINDIRVEQVIDEGPGFQDHLARHESLKTPSRVRFYLVPQASSVEQKERLFRAATREARILLELSHPNVLRCREFVSSGPTGGPALVFDHDVAFERLDAFVRTHPDLSFGERASIVQKVGEALAFCHSKQVLHRGLDPRAVLVRRVESTVEGRKVSALDVKIFNFQLAHTATSDGTSHVSALGDSAAFRAPELMGDALRAREASDVFSLGALAWFVFVGRAPAKDMAEQHEVLLRDGCYSLAVASDALVGLRARAREGAEGAEADAVNGDLDALVRFATASDVGARCSSVTDFLNLLLEVRPDTEHKRPIVDAQPGDVLEADDKTQVEVVKLLGSGASSKVFRVRVDQGQYAIKVALDRAQDDRLEAESELLERVQGDRIVRRHRRLYFDRRLVLLLDDAGETLADVIAARGALPLADAHRWGEHLLLAVERLEELGVVHKDIKPANLGVSATASGKSTHAKLFDFSLAAEDPERVDVGTAAYRDPFLFLRKRWDFAADRYSAAMTLYEMLTGTRVRWGRDDVVVGSSDEASVEADRFDPSVREELAAFFRKCFAREAEQRFASGEEMRMAWVELFARRGGGAASAPVVTEPVEGAPKGKREPQYEWTDAELSALGPRSSIEVLPLSTRARNALDRAGMLLFAEVLSSTKAKLQTLDGVGRDTLREILALREAFRGRTSATGTSASALAATHESVALEALAPCVEALLGDDNGAKAKKWRSIARALFGLDEGGRPLDAQAVATLRSVSRQAVYIHLQSARAYWREHALHEPLTVRVLELLAQRGDVATVDQLAVDVALSFNERVDDKGSLVFRQARALVEVVRLCASNVANEDGVRLLWDAVLHDEQWVATDRALLEPLRALGALADELSKRAVLASADDAQRLLQAQVSETPLARMGTERLIALAAEASRGAAVSARLELYPKGMSARQALRLCSSVLGESAVDEARLRTLVKSRYPLAEELGTGAALEAMVREELDLVFDRERAVFERARRADGQSSTVISQVAEGRPRAFPRPIEPLQAVRALACDDEAAREFDERVRVAARRGTFRVVEVDALHAAVVGRALATRLQTVERSLDRALWESMQAVAAEDAIEWSAVIDADREGPSGEAWALLRGLAADACKRLLGQWQRERGAIVLRDLGLAARYGLREFIEGLVELARRDDGPAVFLVLARMQDQGEAPIDGGVLPGLSVPNPFAVPRMHPPKAWWVAVG